MKSFVFSLLFLAFLVFSAKADENTAPNVLFIAVDDLRPELGCYGKKHIHSPNIDKLANQGTLFERAFCMVPTCGASRASMMTGIRPTKKRFVNYLAFAAKDAPGITTMNTHFKKHGYHTVSLGKIFHSPKDNEHGWSEPTWRPSGIGWYQLPKNIQLHEKRQKQGSRSRGPAWESADVEDEAYSDGVLAQKAISTLRDLKKEEQPFFLAVGFLKPHLPFIAPKKYWDLYDRDSIELPVNYRVPDNAPKESIHTSGEMRSYAGIPAKGPLSIETAKSMIHGYCACVSYTDAQIGKLIKELDQLELSNNTIVVLWGDHGWNLGDHTLWCKHSCFESSMRIPLIVKVPSQATGESRSGLIESIDLYPTLCELTGLTLPKHLEGYSFAKYLKDDSSPWKKSAVGRFQNGDTIRTDQFRFTEYTDKKNNALSNMLYDHTADAVENQNISKAKAKVVTEMSKELHKIKANTIQLN